MITEEERQRRGDELEGMATAWLNEQAAVSPARVKVPGGWLEVTFIPD